MPTIGTCMLLGSSRTVGVVTRPRHIRQSFPSRIIVTGLFSGQYGQHALPCEPRPKANGYEEPQEHLFHGSVNCCCEAVAIHLSVASCAQIWLDLVLFETRSRVSAHSSLEAFRLVESSHLKRPRVCRLEVSHKTKPSVQSPELCSARCQPSTLRFEDLNNMAGDAINDSVRFVGKIECIILGRY